MNISDTAVAEVSQGRPFPAWFKHHELRTHVSRGQAIRWVLEQGSPKARAFLPQLEQARVNAFRCLCGCASINLLIEGFPEPSGGLHILADFVFSTDKALSGILASFEVYGLAAGAPKSLQLSGSLKPFRTRETLLAQ